MLPFAPSSATLTSSRNDDAPADPPSRITAGDVETFDRLFVAYARPLRGFIYTYIGSWEAAEDLVDEVFLQMWLRLADVKVIREAKAYLFSTARNQALNYMRRQRVEARHRQDFVSSESGAVEPRLPVAVSRQLADRARDLTDDDIAAALRQAIDTLPPRQRQIVLLKLHRPVSHEAVAKQLGLAPTTVSEHFRQAVERLRTLLPVILRSISKS